MSDKTGGPAFPRRPVVVTGSYRQFCDWCHKQDIATTDAIYADSNERLVGLELHEDDIVYTGDSYKSSVTLSFLMSRIRVPSQREKEAG